MNRRQVIGAAGLGVAGLVGAGGARGQQPKPTAEAIQTRIANLEATLTAIAAPVGRTLTAADTFDLIGTWSESRFRVEVGRLVRLSGSLHDSIYDKTIPPRVGSSA